MNFENLIGNEEIKQLLEDTIRQKNISHSYIFSGPRGIGKYEFAKQFAKMILCTADSKACNECKSCIEFENSNNPDISIINPDGNSIKIEQIRNLISKSSEKPIISSKKVYIINDSDTMTKEAQNSLLKTLEEPPTYLTIILITSNENKLINTIRSRCTKIKFNQIQDDILEKYLEKNYNINNIDKETLKLFRW